MKPYRKWLAGLTCAVLLASCAFGCSRPGTPVSGGSSAGSAAETEGTAQTTAPSAQESGAGTTAETNTSASGGTKATTARPAPIPTKTLNVSRKLKEGSSEMDRSMLGNPDRGFRYETYLNVSNLNDPDRHWSSQMDPTSRLKAQMEMYMSETPQLAQIYFYLSGYNNTPTIPEYGMKRMQEYFDYARELKIRLLVRFAYQNGGEGLNEAPDSVMFSHIKQLGPLLEKNKDVIHVVQMGFLGAWAEWHSYKMEHDRVRLIREVANMTPKGIYLQIRIPEYKNLIPKADPIFSRLGYHNDSLFGTVTGSQAGLGTGNVDVGKPDWDQVTREAAYIPIDGELFWGKWSINQDGNSDGFLLDGFKVIEQLSQHRFTSLSINHNYHEDGFEHKYSMQYWQETAITEQWLKNNGIFYAPGWFKDSAGQAVSRTVFDFIRDYLGYRLVGTDWKASGKLEKKGSVKAELSLNNYGFSAPYNLESGFAILDENNNPVKTVKAGTPTDWHSRNPINYNDGKLLTHKVTANCPLPDKAGRYKLAFYLKNPLGVGAQLANDIPFENGYNILETIEIG